MLVVLGCYAYSTCHKKLYEIRRLSALVICSFSAASSTISVESSKGVHGIIKGYPRNRQRVSADPSKGVREIVLYSSNSRRQEYIRDKSVQWCIPTINDILQK